MVAEDKMAYEYGCFGYGMMLGGSGYFWMILSWFILMLLVFCLFLFILWIVKKIKNEEQINNKNKRRRKR